MTFVRVSDDGLPRYFPATGLLVVPQNAVNYLDPESLENGDASLSVLHEIIHHVQTLSSVYLYLDSLDRLRASVTLLNKSDGPTKQVAAYNLTRRNRVWQHRAHGVSVTDLCEGTAVLSSFQALAPGASVHDFLMFREEYFPGKGNSPYRRTFDIMTNACGPDVAYDLLPVVAFLALQGDVPGASFEDILRHPAVHGGRLVGKSLREITDELAWLPSIAAIYENVERLHPSQRHPVFYPVMTELAERMPLWSLLELFARPSQLVHGPLHQMAHLFWPPVMLGPYRMGERAVGRHFGVASTDVAVRVASIDYTAHVRAGDRLIGAPVNRIACPHKECPNHASLVCSGVYIISPTHENCRFRRDVLRLAGKEPFEVYEDMQGILDSSQLHQLQTSTNLSTLFPDAPDGLTAPRATLAEQLDQKYDLDEVDNDGQMLIFCRKCGAIGEDRASQRRLRRGYVVHCPLCDEPHELKMGSVAIINTDSFGKDNT